MAIDLTGGLDVAREHVFASRPDDPDMRDAVNMWVSDDRGVLGLPRFAVEALASKWDAHDLSLNVAFPDGRVLSTRASGPTHPALDAQGRPTVLGAGPLAFRCVEPFRRWEVTYRGTSAEMTTLAQMNGALPGRGPSVAVEFHIECTMAAPPWIQGTMSAEARAMIHGDVVGGLMGGPRYEQLFRATGTLRIGDEVHAFNGSGLRIRRQGVRRIEGFWGHCWQSALFPSGRGFGYITYPPRGDGKPTYNEGYVFEGDGELVPARVVDAPWLRRLTPRGDDVSVVLETARGTIRIEGETAVATFAMGRPEMPKDFPVLQQAGVRYRWDGETTWGMMERSTPADQITR
ncbi:MAG TPA: hypothetical protein VJM11_05975 [Nevskiaceae bacterium]|nr:hypothetical protein [Nevskiaceae bacterium]